MKLYRFEYDGEVYWIEATSIHDAVLIWKAHVAIAWGKDYDGTEEPESMTLVFTGAVLRG